jgi:hypothetical protein
MVPSEIGYSLPQVMECRRLSVSLCLDACRLDDRPPFLDFGFLEGAEGFGCLLSAWDDFLPEWGKPLMDGPIRQSFNHSGIQLKDHPSGRRLRHPKPMPQGSVETRYPTFVGGGNVGRSSPPLSGHYHVCFELTGPDLLQQRGDLGNRQINLTRYQILHERSRAPVWHKLKTRAGCVLEKSAHDATSEILSMFLVEEEGTASTFRALREVVSEHGLFCELYTDRGGHYVYTPEPGVASKTQLTQVGRALKQLGIRQIAARSPEARGRSERMVRTLQDRVPKELRLAGITTVQAANISLKAYIDEHNARFAVPPEQEGTMFVADRDGAYREILCVQEERQVGNDNTVSWKGRRLQIAESPLRRHFVKATVRVHEYPDGTVSVLWGPHRLAQFTAEGKPIEIAPTSPSLAPCSGPSRTSPGGRAKSASLTAPAHVAPHAMRVGTKKRASGRTKKQTKAETRKRARIANRRQAA